MWPLNTIELKIVNEYLIFLFPKEMIISAQYVNPKNVRTRHMNRQKLLLFFTFLFIYSFGVFAATQEEETPRILLFFGRFHPLLLHLPIGALLLTFFIEIMDRIRKNDSNSTITNALAFSAFFAVATSILGYFLSLEGGYGEEVLNIHMWAGFSMAALTSLLFLSKKTTKEKFKKAYFPLFIITLLLTIVTGHYGSVLTHGDTFLTAYSPMESDDDQELILETDSLYYYKHVITVILEDKCTQCHNPNKTKGELNLTSIKHIIEGGENGAVLKPGDVVESPMYASLMLPIEEDKHMPPTGKPQLTRNEIWLIKNWINSGADFKKQLVNYSENDTLSNYLKDYLVLPKRKVKVADFKDIIEITNHGFTIRKLIFGQPYLSATYTAIDKDISKKALRSLYAISDQLTELNLQESGLTDDLVKNINNLETLKSLRLDHTAISDKSLDYLKNYTDLQTLNLFNTNVTTEKISELKKFINPPNIFFGNEEDQDAASNSILAEIRNDFIIKTALQKPSIPEKKMIFTGEIKIELRGNLKGEQFYYSLDGQDPDSTSLLYKEPITITTSTKFKARSYKENWFPSKIIERDYSKIKHKIKEVTVKYQPNKSYEGVHKLYDLERGSNRFRDGKWNGYLDDFVATVDLGEEAEFKGLSVNCLEGLPSYIFFPLDMEVYVGNDLKSLKKVGYLDIPPTDRKGDIKIKNFIINFNPIKARYIKVVMRNMDILPKWHEAAGADAYIFIDEIMIL
jgi:uncharacterized membrane protein